MFKTHLFHLNFLYKNYIWTPAAQWLIFKLTTIIGPAKRGVAIVKIMKQCERTLIVSNKEYNYPALYIVCAEIFGRQKAVNKNTSSS